MTRKIALPPLILVYEDRITESLAFKDALQDRAYACHALKPDPAETYRALSCNRHGDSVVVGCTKGAAAFVLGELARAQGHHLLVYAEHRYLKGERVQHTLHLPTAGIETAETAQNWSNAMAHAALAGISYPVTDKKQVITATISRPATSPDYIVTWGILQNSKLANYIAKNNL